MAFSKSVAIIGGGVSGLAAACFLAGKGVSVNLFEANDKVGGSCATTRLDDYTFSDGAVYLTMPMMLDHLFTSLGLNRDRLLPLHSITALQSATLPDGTVVDIKSGPEIALLSSQGTFATADVQREVGEFLDKWEETLSFFTDDILVRPLSLWRILFKGWRHLARLRSSAASLITESFSNESLQAALGGALLYAGAPADKQPGAALLGLVSMLRDGYFLPAGGMGRLPEVLREAVLARGGRIHLNSPVKRIRVHDKRACAIELNDGETIEVDAIISTASAMHTYTSLLSAEDSPPAMKRKAERSPLSHRGFVLQLGLTNEITPRSHTNYVLPWLRHQSQIFEPDRIETRWLTYLVPTLTCPELARAGGSIVELFPAINQAIDPDDWSEERKDTVAQSTIALLQREHEVDIKVSRILSPKEFKNDSHLYAGALYGISPTAGPGALFKHRSPIGGLYLAGQTSWPGFGVIGAGFSGIFSAEVLLRHESN
jgi:phytoene desaturase